MDEQSDRALVSASQRGDVAAFTTLTRKHWGHVYAVAYAGTLRHEDAEDIAQETFLRAYTRLWQLRAGAAFESWVCRIAWSYARAHRRKGRREVLMDVGEELADTLEYPPDQERYETEDDARRIVAQGLDAMPSDLRLPLVMRYMTGDSYAAIAARLAISEAGARTRVRRARDFFATFIRRAGMEGDCRDVLRAHLAVGPITAGFLGELAETLSGRPPPQAPATVSALKCAPAAFTGCIAVVGLLSQLGGKGEGNMPMVAPPSAPVYVVTSRPVEVGPTVAGVLGDQDDASWLPPGATLVLADDFSQYASRRPLPGWTSGAYSEPTELGPDGKPGVGVINTNIPSAYLQFPLTRGTVYIEFWAKPHEGRDANFGVWLGNDLGGWKNRSEVVGTARETNASAVNSEELLIKSDDDKWRYFSGDGLPQGVPIRGYRGEWTRVRIVFRTGISTYDLYLDGELVRRDTPSFSGRTNGVSLLGLNSGRWRYEEDKGSYFDGLRIYVSEEEAVPVDLAARG